MRKPAWGYRRLHELCVIRLPWLLSCITHHTHTHAPMCVTTVWVLCTWRVCSPSIIKFSSTLCPDPSSSHLFGFAFSLWHGMILNKHSLDALEIRHSFFFLIAKNMIVRLTKNNKHLLQKIWKKLKILSVLKPLLLSTEIRLGPDSHKHSNIYHISIIWLSYM